MWSDGCRVARRQHPPLLLNAVELSLELLPAAVLGFLICRSGEVAQPVAICRPGMALLLIQLLQLLRVTSDHVHLHSSPGTMARRSYPRRRLPSLSFVHGPVHAVRASAYHRRHAPAR